MKWSDRFEAATTAGPNQITTGAVVIAADADGNIIHQESRGVTSVDPAEAPRPMTADTPMWIASCTKLLATIAALQQVERGKLALDADVRAILPEVMALEILEGYDQESGQPRYRKPKNRITLRYLLSQQSGMGYDFLNKNLMRWRKERGEEFREWEWPIVDRCATPLMYEPGEGWAYSVSIDWAGKMVERVNGNQRLGEYFQENIFTPLGMQMVTFRPLEHRALREELAGTTERKGPGEFVPVPRYFRGENMDPGDDQGGGGLYCTPSEYIKVLVSLLKNDGKLLRPENVRQMFTPQLKDPEHLIRMTKDPELGIMVRAAVESDDWQYGFGGTLHTADVPGVCREGTLSWQGLPNCYWWIDPRQKNCGLYFSQLMPAGDPESMKLAIDFRRHIFSLCN